MASSSPVVTKDVLDFIVIGAQKSGTTSLFEYLRRHPQLSLPQAKEVPYFSNELRYREDWHVYLNKAFPFSDPDCKWGTVTPQYMYGGVMNAGRRPDGSCVETDVHTVPERIRDQLPDVRLIAILRDPVQRAHSHHAMMSLNGWEERPFDQAIRELLEPAALERARRVPDENSGYVVWGEYARILSGYLEVFDSDRLLVLFTAELRNDAPAVLRRVFEFLSVDADFVPDNVGANYRQGAGARRINWLDLNRLQHRVSSSSLARGAWHALPERTRRRVDAGFDRINYQLRLWNRRSAVAPPSSEAEIDLMLRRHYLADAQLLARLCGRTPPWAEA
jgi:hypothetical protein